MMSKRVILWLMLALMICLYPVQAWAAPLPASQTGQQVIRLVGNPELEAFEASRPPAPLGLGGIAVEPWFWMLSIPAPGLGQLLMGEPTRAAFFFLAPLTIGWIFLVAWQGFGEVNSNFMIGSPQYQMPSLDFVTLSPGGAGGGGAVVLLLLYALPLISILGVWGWNVADAYALSLQLQAGQDENAAIVLQRRRELLLALLQATDVNQLRPTGAGLGLNHRLASF